MTIQSVNNGVQAQGKLTRKQEKPATQEPKDGFTPSNPIVDFYNSNRTIVNIGGGALIGAGIAKAAGLPSEAIMSAASTGAVAGWFAGKKGPMMAAGAGAGAAIATIAGVPGAGVVGAAGTGALVAWLFG